ncbi:ArsR/SmtB family transcription factor [Streptomyces sp. NPDC003877]
MGSPKELEPAVTSPAVSSRDLPHPARDEIRLEGVLHALSDPMRLRIVRELAAGQGELSCSDFELPVTKSTTTHHFRVLRESGVIRQVYRGTAKMNGLRRDDLEELFPGLLDALLEAAGRQAARLGG